MKNNKFIVKIILVVSILISAIGVCTAYPKIEKDSTKFSYDVFESEHHFLKYINRSNYALYYSTYKNNGEEVLNPSQLLLNLKSVKDDQYRINNYEKIFNEKIFNWVDNLKDQLENLEYYAINKSNNVVIERSNLKLEELINNESSSDKISEFKKIYEFYVIIDYDENGNISISNSYNANKIEILGKLDELQRDNYDFEIYSLEGAKINPIKNMTYIYAVPHNLIFSDHISYIMQNKEYYAYSQASYLFINMAMVFIILVSLLVPYKEVKDIKVFKIIVNIPIEILIIIVSCAIAFIYNSSEIIMVSSIKGELINLVQLELNNQIKNLMTYSLNIIYFAIWFSIISIGIFILKHIHRKKVRVYLRENSIIIKFILRVSTFIKKGWSHLIDFDLAYKNNSKLVKLLLINLLIISLICTMWIFGIILAIIYTVVIFLILRKKYERINNDYNNLLKLTNEIASGNLDINNQEDLGIFNSLKDEVTQIQKGFKNAVREELKSQKMKTELISNVSHDLKTPLTSIITYIDLLKDENLSRGNREEYLEVLDRKSQRLKDLIEDLFEVSKATSGDINLNIIDVDIVSLMKQTLLELSDKINESDLIIKKNLPSEKVVLRLDSQRTFRVFENLIINITKYSMKGSRVYIDILEGLDNVTISFKNIAAEEIDYDVNYITDRFVRGDKSRNTEGSGLGLAIAKSFVELQGGSFEVSNDGDLFKVIIVFKK